MAPPDADAPIRRLADWDAERLRSLAAAYGTPLYVLDLDRVRANYARLEAAFADGRVLYAMKANACRAALGALAEAGAGVECASAGELQRALDAGFDPAAVHYTAVNPPDRDLDRAVSLAADRPGLTVTAGAADTVDRLEARGYAGRLCVRVNPGVGAGHHAKVTTGDDPKFGVPYDRAGDLLADAAIRGFDVVGVHAHAGSGISGDDLAAHRELVGRMGELARASPVDLEFVDVGGGFGVPYRPEDPPLDLDAVAAATREALGTVDADLVVEPGRYVVADAGVLVTEVNTVKPVDGTVVAGVDAGMTTLLRPAMYDAYHHVRSLAPDADDRASASVTLAGPVCETADVLGRDRTLPRPSRGDLLAVGNAGAYGYEMASQYNSRPRPAEVVLEDGTARVGRRRETVADLTRLEP
ncbi:MAG: diaminopimelate decarboxylase [Halobacteriaceae archaeon]